MKTISLEESDDSLMIRAASGDTTAFDAIVHRHQHSVQRFAARMLGGDAARGADVAVGAFLRLWEVRAAYRPCGKLSAWLIRTTYRLCLDTLGATQSAGQVDLSALCDTAEAPLILIERTALARAVRDAVMELPEPHRAVIILSAYEGMTYEQISEALDIPAGTVASRKNHAIAVLRRRLAAWE